MSREKLKALGLNLPLFPTTSVGSFPKARLPHPCARRSDEGQNSPEQNSPSSSAKPPPSGLTTQEKLGIDVLVDGEMYRGDMVAYFAERLAGLHRRRPGSRLRQSLLSQTDYHGRSRLARARYRRLVAVRAKPHEKTGERNAHRRLHDHGLELQRALSRSPFDGHGSRRRNSQGSRSPHSAGCKIIQIDEPALSVRPEELPIALEAMEHTTKNLEAYFVTHACYGEFEHIYPGMLDLAVDNFDLEMSNSDLDLLGVFAAIRSRKTSALASSTSTRYKMETAGAVRQRIESALKILPGKMSGSIPTAASRPGRSKKPSKNSASALPLRNHFAR